MHETGVFGFVSESVKFFLHLMSETCRGVISRGVMTPQ